MPVNNPLKSTNRKGHKYATNWNMIFIPNVTSTYDLLLGSLEPDGFERLIILVKDLWPYALLSKLAIF